MIRIAIIEDDDDFRESLAVLIDKRADFCCISAYADCESALQNLKRDALDVILMDIGLPGMSGIEGTQKIKERLPESDIIVLTIHEDDVTVFDALCAGATGYLTKDIPPTRILDAIAEVYWGGAPMSSNIARMIVHSFQMVSHSPLTKRESDILSQMCKGMSYKSIADNLFISQETVRSHIKHVYQKLHVHSKSEAIVKAFRERLVRV
jgi:DNA-binding NarL/FixJ family response regulator